MKKIFLSLITLILFLNCTEKKIENTEDPGSKKAGTAEFQPGNPNQQIVYSDALKAVIWGMPAVNFDMMYQAFLNAGAKDNQLVYWSKPSNWKNQLLTPNTDALYLLPFFNTKNEGPIVIEIPPADNGAIVGTIMDYWQTPLEDVGQAGADGGKGGKYLILPPDYKEKVPAGYIVLPSECYKGYALFRSIPKSGSESDIATAVAYMKRIKLYPLSKSTAVPKTVFVDVTTKLFDANIYYDKRFLESLNRVVQDENWLERDKIMIDVLKSIGIQKGKQFTPSEATEKVLNSAVKDAYSWLDGQYEATRSYYPDNHWFFAISVPLLKSWASGFKDNAQYPINDRGVMYYWGFSSGKRTTGGQMNQLYLFSGRDKNNNALSGNSNYHLKVPANVPAKQYWSATLYNRATHTLIRDVEFASRSSLQQTLVKNSDGTIDLYFGPEAPDGKHDNWIPTKKGENFEIIFRLYGIEKPILDKTWILPDVEEVQ